MNTNSLDVTAMSGQAGATHRHARTLNGALLLAPATLFLGFFLLLPSLLLLSFSFLTQSVDGHLGLPLQLNSYGRLILDPSYQKTMLVTLRVSFWTSLITMLVAYPLAMVIAYGNAFCSRLTMALVVMPLVVSVIVRTYGWQLVLANSPNGVLNWLLQMFGLQMGGMLKILYTEWAVIVASVHVFLPLMVLPIATSLGRINPALNQAARMLGANAFQAFLRVTLPLSLPGLTAGLTVVFSLTAASYVTPQMVGGTTGAMLGVLLEQQMMTAYDWPMSAAIGVVMVVIALVANVGANWILDRKFHVNQKR